MSVSAGVAAEQLAAYALAIGDRVEVELLVLSGVGAVPSGPRIVEGRVVGATRRVLVLDGRTSDVRIPWPAIATIRTAIAPHPATT